MDQFDKSFKVQQIMGRASKYNSILPMVTNNANNGSQSNHSQRSNSSLSSTGSGNKMVRRPWRNSIVCNILKFQILTVLSTIFNYIYII